MPDGRLRNMTSVYITKGDRILLLYRVGSRVGEDNWRGFGGHFENDECNDARACALRELYEETGLREDALTDLKLRYVTLRQKNGELRQVYYFFAEWSGEGLPTLTSDEGEPRWFRLDELEERPMPVTAREVLRHYVREGRHTDTLYGGLSARTGMNWTALEEF